MDLNKQEIIQVLREADCVCFDVDSTICPDEGIDEFAKFYGVDEKVKELTKQAMSGSMTFQEALAARLKIIDPTYERLKQFLQQRELVATKGAMELINKLKERNCHVYFVSGGFQEIINPIAKMLGVPIENIYANKLLFYYTGEYFGADTNQPTCRTGGKAKVIEELRKNHKYKTILMIGDGATDMEACPPADAFIGFGANVVRSIVKEKANWFASSFQEILDELRD